MQLFVHENSEPNPQADASPSLCSVSTRAGGGNSHFVRTIKLWYCPHRKTTSPAHSVPDTVQGGRPPGASVGCPPQGDMRSRDLFTTPKNSAETVEFGCRVRKTPAPNRTIKPIHSENCPAPTLDSTCPLIQRPVLLISYSAVSATAHVPVAELNKAI